MKIPFFVPGKTGPKTLYLILFVLISFSTIQAQSISRLDKIYSKGKSRKLIRVAKRGLAKHPTSADYNYYLILGYLLESNRWDGANAEEYYSAAVTAYQTHHESLDHNKRQKLIREFRGISMRVFNAIPDSEYDTRYDYSVFFAEYLADTIEFYRINYQNKRLEGKRVGIEDHREQFIINTNNTISRQKGEIQYITPVEFPTRKNLIMQAEKGIGTPWVYAGEDPGSGFDCSGYVIWTYSKFGFKLPHKSNSLATIGKPVSAQDAMPGDLVCFGDTEYNPSNVYHIGMIHSKENETINIIHCGTSTGVTIAPLTSGYWSKVKYFIVRIN